MKIFTLFFGVPYILAAELKNIQCPDGSVCAVGKSCCQSPKGAPECCDSEEGERWNETLLPGPESPNAPNMSAEVCEGHTYCKLMPDWPDFCCRVFDKPATCCWDYFCCPNGYNCCGPEEVESFGTKVNKSWCCPSFQKCGPHYMFCGAASIYPGIAVMVLLFILPILDKRF